MFVFVYRYGIRCVGEVVVKVNNNKCVVGVVYNFRIGGEYIKENSFWFLLDNYYIIFFMLCSLWLVIMFEI